MVARIQNTYCRLNRAKGEDLKVEDIKLLIEYPTGLEQSVIGHRCPSDFLTAPRAQMHRGEWEGGGALSLWRPCGKQAQSIAERSSLP